MASGVVDATGLPATPLDAAAQFHARIVAVVRKAMVPDGDVAIVFDPADHTHSAWRLAAIQELAREAAPGRVNGVAAQPSNPEGTAEVLRFLHANPGVTGQLLTVGSG